MGVLFLCLKMEYVTIALLILLTVKEVVSFKERREVYDRLMSKNLPEFKDNEKHEENTLSSEDDGTLPVFEAKEEILNGSEEE